MPDMCAHFRMLTWWKSLLLLCRYPLFLPLHWWGKDDVETEFPCAENSEISKGCLFKAWSESDYSLVRFAYCEKVVLIVAFPVHSPSFFSSLPNFCLPGAFTFIFSQCSWRNLYYIDESDIHLWPNELCFALIWPLRSTGYYICRLKDHLYLLFPLFFLCWYFSHWTVPPICDMAALRWPRTWAQSTMKSSSHPRKASKSSLKSSTTWKAMISRQLELL